MLVIGCGIQKICKGKRIWSTGRKWSNVKWLDVLVRLKSRCGFIEGAENLDGQRMVYYELKISQVDVAMGIVYG